MKLKTHYYQQFDADFDLGRPAEGYGGWKQADVEIDPAHTALVVMHAWDTGSRHRYPGWYRCVDYLPRAQAICRDVFPGLLGAVRASGMALFHVCDDRDYYKDMPGYLATVDIAGPSPSAEMIDVDRSLEALREFHSQNVFVGKHNADDVSRGFEECGFAKEALPFDGEPIAKDSLQLLALCKKHGVNHLIYTGFAVNACIQSSPGGMTDMSRHGVMCSTIRQATTAVECKETVRGEKAKELALWWVSVVYGFVFDADDVIAGLSRWRRNLKEGKG